jgi:hypothetical protein
MSSLLYKANQKLGGADTSFHNSKFYDEEASGLISGLPKDYFTPGRRYTMNGYAILANVSFPSIVFTVLFALMTYKPHYTNPWLVWAAVAVLGFGSAMCSGILALTNYYSQESTPMWYVYSTLALFAATLTACTAGSWNFATYSQAYYDYMSLVSYAGVEPGTTRGQQMMESGRVYWSDGVRIAEKFTMGFKHHDVYCVAPITQSNSTLPNYDFWAVGKNCCGKQFTCGEAQNPHARSSLRELTEEDRPFYRLAVEQAVAAYNLNANHPLFYKWVTDPLDDIRMYRHDATTNFLIGTGVVWLSNLCCVTYTVFAFGRIGSGRI